MTFLDLLQLPETKSIQDLDSMETTILHRQIIQKKGFLRSLYTDFYRMIKNAVPDIESEICVELGSGAGFIKEIMPHVITSEVLSFPHVDRCFSADQIPFDDRSIDAFLLMGVFHHLRDCATALKEMSRCLKTGGKIIMIEPANTPWGRFIYQNFHHEAYDMSQGWKLSGEGRLSSANGALPWIVFIRDRKKFESTFPSLKLSQIKTHTPFRYLLSGGFSMRQLVPSWAYPVITGVEWLLSPLNPFFGMFYFIEMFKVSKD